MSLKTAQALAWNLARTLMTVIVLIRTDKRFFAMPVADFDGEIDQIVQEYSPWP